MLKNSKNTEKSEPTVAVSDDSGDGNSDQAPKRKRKTKKTKGSQKRRRTGKQTTEQMHSGKVKREKAKRALHLAIQCFDQTGNEIEQKDEEITALKEQNEELSKTIEEQKQTVEEKDKTIKEQKQTVEEKKRIIAELTLALSSQDNANKSLKEQIDELKKSIEEQKQTIEEKAQTIASLSMDFSPQDTFDKSFDKPNETLSSGQDQSEQLRLEKEHSRFEKEQLQSEIERLQLEIGQFKSEIERLHLENSHLLNDKIEQNLRIAEFRQTSGQWTSENGLPISPWYSSTVNLSPIAAPNQPPIPQSPYQSHNFPPTLTPISASRYPSQIPNSTGVTSTTSAKNSSIKSALSSVRPNTIGRQTHATTNACNCNECKMRQSSRYSPHPAQQPPRRLPPPRNNYNAAPTQAGSNPSQVRSPTLYAKQSPSSARQGFSPSKSGQTQTAAPHYDCPECFPQNSATHLNQTHSSRKLPQSYPSPILPTPDRNKSSVPSTQTGPNPSSVPSSAFYAKQSSSSDAPQRIQPHALQETPPSKEEQTQPAVTTNIYPNYRLLNYASPQSQTPNTRSLPPQQIFSQQRQDEPAPAQNKPGKRT
jgi:prefoldin subunit 5